jgi:hypothetical protein
MLNYVKTICKLAAQKCVWSERGNEAKRNDLANEAPSPLMRAQRKPFVMCHALTYSSKILYAEA